MRKSIAAVCGILFSASSLANCHNHLNFGVPGNSDQQLCREGYALGYNYSTKVADWVAYRLTADSVNLSFTRSDKFKEDGELPVSSRSTLSDYYKSGYDRGHMAPRASVDVTKNAELESFLMSNMAPQRPGFNRVGWRILEETIRDWANTYGELHVVTGPIYYDNEANIGEGVAIPGAFYKVILDPYYNEAIGFVIPHRDVSGSELEGFITTVDEVEALTGLDFFADLPDKVEIEAEAQWWQMW